MDGSFGFSKYFTITLGGLDFYKASAPGFSVGCPNPLVELDLNELEKRIEK